MPDGPTRKWRELLDERQNAEIDFAKLYASDFHHGTDGHNARIIIATLAKLLDTAEDVAVQRLKEKAESPWDYSTQKPDSANTLQGGAHVGMPDSADDEDFGHAV